MKESAIKEVISHVYRLLIIVLLSLILWKTFDINDNLQYISKITRIIDNIESDTSNINTTLDSIGTTLNSSNTSNANLYSSDTSVLMYLQQINTTIKYFNASNLSQLQQIDTTLGSIARQLMFK